MPKTVLCGSSMQDAFREWGQMLVEQLGERRYAETAALLHDKESDPMAVIGAVRDLHVRWAEGGKKVKAGDKDLPNGLEEIISHDGTADDGHVDAFAGFDRRTKKKALLEIARNLDRGVLGDLAIARVHEDLIDEPKDPRARLQNRRLALELDGRIGANPSELHLHEHRHEVLGPEQHAMIAEAVRKAFKGSAITVAAEKCEVAE